NDGELVKVTVAVRTKYKQWLYKQVAVHGLNSDICYVKDMVFHYIAGYSVGWFEQGAQTAPRWYESTEWDYSEDKYFDPFAPVVNREYLDKFPKYKYSAVNLYKGVDVLKYLRFYEKYPQIEYLMKAGLDGYAFSKQILRNRQKQTLGKSMKIAQIKPKRYNVDVIKARSEPADRLRIAEYTASAGIEKAEASNCDVLQNALKNSLHISQPKNKAFIPTTIISGVHYLGRI
ncbi:MAG: hypothetical protein ACLRSW_16425, partial [Christensenellaceae bacterium]